ncbi:MAG: AAA family ATPase [Planctomycetota bacterium]|nr:AAA family ATPase [Planctomycetota bacterium]
MQETLLNQSVSSSVLTEQSIAPCSTTAMRSLCVVSGKGGTGKSMISASLAFMLSEQGNTLLFDADLGVANAHILQGIRPTHTIAEVIAGTASISNVVTPCYEGLDLLAGGSGVAQLASLNGGELELLAAGLRSVEERYSHMVVDSAAGLSRQTVAFAAASDRVLVVTTPAVTALTDAYAFLKVLLTRRPHCRPRLVINRVVLPEEGERAAERLIDVTKRFLGVELECVAQLPDDRAAFVATQEQRPVVRGGGDSPLGLALMDLGRYVSADLDKVRPRGFGTSLHNHLIG